MTKVSSIKPNKILAQDKVRPKVALFDLDYTLITADCTEHWLRLLLTRTAFRKVLVISLLPLIKLLTIFNVNLATRNSVFLWAATVGLSKAKYLQLRDTAAQHLVQTKGLNTYREGLERIRWHQSQGHTIIVVTGALRWLARDVCRTLDIQYDHLLGSSERDWGGGRVSDVFCYHQNKVDLLEQHNYLNDGRADYGYSDSAADIPMLSVCEHIYIVNPKPKCQQQFEQALAKKATLLQWRE